jgi:hypothetical protein
LIQIGAAFIQTYQALHVRNYSRFILPIGCLNSFS